MYSISKNDIYNMKQESIRIKHATLCIIFEWISTSILTCTRGTVWPNTVVVRHIAISYDIIQFHFPIWYSSEFSKTGSLIHRPKIPATVFIIISTITLDKLHDVWSVLLIPVSWCKKKKSKKNVFLKLSNFMNIFPIY